MFKEIQANYPQLCGSWPDNEWPHEIPVYQPGAFVSCCADPHAEIGARKQAGREAVREGLQRIDGQEEHSW